MKITIQREPFFKAFQLAATVAPSRSPKAILQNVKIECTDSACVLTATDMEVGIRVVVGDVKIETAGSAVIPVTRLSMILRESRDETLNINATPDKTIIKGKGSKFELQAHNPDEFPDVADFEAKDYYELPANVLRELIKRTLFATDAESSRYALGGVKLEMEEEKLVAIGTDGRRLAVQQGKIESVGTPADTGTSTIVPSRSMQLIDRILPDSDDKVQISPQANELLVRSPDGIFFTRLVEGRYPKWRDVIPKREDGHKIEIAVGPMYQSLRQAAIVSSDESRGVDFTFGEGSLVLSNTTAEVGESRVEMPVPYDGESMTITLDHRYVADFLKVLQPDKTFTFDIKDGEQAAYCSTEDEYGYVIMPLSKDRR